MAILIGTRFHIITISSDGPIDDGVRDNPDDPGDNPIAQITELQATITGLTLLFDTDNAVLSIVLKHG